MSYIFKFVTLVSTICIISCNILPPDLQARKDANNAKYQDLLYKENTASTSSDYEQLVSGYTDFKNETISYTAECNRRGISKNNDPIIKEADDKISKFQSLIASNKTTNISNERNCEICGNAFNGDGYCQDDDGSWRPCKYPYSTSICSHGCAMKQKQKSEQAWKEVEEKVEEINGRSGNSLPKGSDKCSLCGGTGIEKNTSHLTDEYGRVCPMCDGKGYVIDGY